MSLYTKPQPSLTPTTLLDEVMSVLAQGEDALFADLARRTWDPRATLADLTGTLSSDGRASQLREAA